MVTSKCLFLVVLAAVVVICFFLLNGSGQVIRLQKMTFSDRPASTHAIADQHACGVLFEKLFSKIVSSYRQCVIGQLKKDPWNDLAPATKKCMGETLWQMLDTRQFFNGDDIKLAMLPKMLDATGNAPQMTEVTIGIGNNIESEKQLRNVLPNCKFYGADPSISAGSIFKEMGEYFEVAVSGEEGEFEAAVLENMQYNKKKIKMVSLRDFLFQYTKTPKVDYLFLDNEGGEYQVFPKLLNSEDADMNGISICQISAEMHGVLMGGENLHSKHKNLLMNLLTDSNFLPVWAESAMNQLRTYYVNVADPYCVRTFLQDKFCDL